MATVSKCRLSYHRRLFLLLLGISWAPVGRFAAYQYGREKYFKIERLDARLQLLNLRLLDELAAGVRPDSLMAGNAGRFPGLRLTILDHKGRVHYDSRSDTTRLANHLNRPEVRAALINGSGYTLERLSESTHGHFFYSAMRGDSLIVRSALPYNLELREVLAGSDDFSLENTERIVHGWIEQKGYSLGQVMNTLRLALVGAGKGPGMYDVTSFIGKEETLRRIDNLLRNLKPGE